MMKLKNGFKKFRLFFACVIVTSTLLLPTFSDAAIYYVATNGNNGNKGSESAPWRTMKFAFGQLVAGDTLFIRGGKYSEILESHNGTNFPSGESWAKPVTIAAFHEEHVTLMGRMAIGIENPLTQYVIFDGITIDASGQPAAIAINGGSHHIRFINGEEKNANQSGHYLSYANDANPDNTFNEFINMNIHHNGFISGRGHGIYVKTSGNLIENCQIHDNAYWGIHNYTLAEDPRAHNNIYRNNLIYNNGSVQGHGGGITINRGDNNTAYNNVLWGNRSGLNANNIGSPKGTKFYNNTVYGNQAEGIFVLSGAIDTQIINNISYKNGQNLIDQGTNTTISNNLMTNPLFMNAAAADFHLQTGSITAINEGIPLEEVKTDRDGMTRPTMAPDIGAYEYHLLNESPQNLRIVTN